MENLRISKEKQRAHLIEKRKGISSERRREASELLSKFNFNSFGLILSFSSFRNEIDTSLLNERLAKEGRLVLLNIDFSLPLPLEKISLVLVPGVGFDREHYRLGYGKGFYDRLLSKNGSLLSWGVGFREQLVDSLPKESHDIPLTELLLF